MTTLAASQSKLLIRGSTLRVINLATNIAVSLYMLPFLVHHLGERYYGMWALIISIIAYLGYMDFGLSKAAQVYIARALNRSSPTDANKVLTTCFSIFMLVGLAVLLLAAGVSIGADYFLDDATEASTFRVAVLVLGFNAGITFPVMAFNGFFSANLRYDIVVLIGLAQLLVKSALVILVVKAGYGLVGMAVFTTLVDLCGHAVKLWVLRRMYRQISLSRALFDRSLIPDLYRYGGKASVHSFADMLRFQIDVVIVGAWLNLSAVAVYSIAARLAEYLRNLLGMVFGVTVPVYVRLDGNADVDGIRSFYFFSSKLATVFTVFLTGNAIVFGGYFIDLWIGPEFSDAYVVLCILLVGAAIHVSQEPALCLLYGFAEHGRYSAMAVFEGLVNVGLSIVLVQKYGLYGVAAATSISVLITASFAFWSVGRRIEQPLLRHLGMYVAALVVGIAMHAASFEIAARVQPDTYLSLFGLAFVVSVIQGAVFWYAMFSAAERSQMLDLVFRSGESGQVAASPQSTESLS